MNACACPYACSPLQVAQLNHLTQEQLAALERQSRSIVRASAEHAAMEDKLQHQEAELQQLRQQLLDHQQQHQHQQQPEQP